jgi:multiple antibiotic resistance protein
MAARPSNPGYHFAVSYVIAFLTLFAAIDVVAVLPVYHSLTSELEPAERRRIVRQSCLTAFLVALAFALAGKAVLGLLGIEVYDFQVAGGILLLVFSIQDLIAGEKARRPVTATLGVVPLGMPLIVGPAVLTALLILIDAHGYRATLTALGLNLALVWAVLTLAPAILRLVGEAGAKALGKLFGLLLAAFAVMMVRRGVIEMVRHAF